MRETTINDLIAAQKRGDATVVDVREPMEYVAGHVPGAIFAPMTQLASRMSQLPKGETLYVICQTGNRSKSMADFLERQGFDAVSVAGGVSAWVAAGQPVVTGTRAAA